MTIEQQIADLTTATTDLTTQALALKAAAEQKMNNGEVYATNAAASEALAVQHKLDAEAARDQAQVSQAAAQTAEQNAVAVVTGGTGSATPAAGKVPVADAQGLINDGWVLPVPSSAEFEARQEINRQRFTVSGFVEFGLNQNTSLTAGEGFTALSSVANQIRLGRAKSVGGFGPSVTEWPVAVVDGVMLKIWGIGAEPNYNNIITLPTAPLATNLVANGRFDIDTGWTKGTGWTISGGKAHCDGTQTAASFLDSDTYNLIAGRTYAYCYKPEVTAGTCSLNISNSGQTEEEYHAVSGIRTGTFVAQSGGTDIQIRASVDFVGSIDDVSIIDMAEVERTDLVFLETWHEKISDKDIVYPYGNVQYGSNTWNGIGLSSSLVAQGYSAFSEGDASTTGYGARWSTLTAAQKHALVNEPLNNIYNDGGELIQVRYRVRVVKGAGASWEYTEALKPRLRYSSTANVVVRGKEAGALPDLASSGQPMFEGVGSAAPAYTASDLGAFQAVDSNWNNLTTRAHRGLCFAVPIALISRRNQGAYHPVFNPQGTRALFFDDGSGANSWFYDKAYKLETLSACFDIGASYLSNKVYQSSGAIAHTSGWQKGHPQGLSYDAVYPDDVIDLRNNVKPTADLRRMLNRELQRAISGAMRGTEKHRNVEHLSAVYSGVVEVAAAASNQGVMNGATRIYVPLVASVINDASFVSSADDSVILLGDNGSVMRVHGFNHINNTGTSAYIWTGKADTTNRASEFNSKFPVGTKITAVRTLDSYVQSSGDILCCDIIGDPDNWFRGHCKFLSSSGQQTIATGEVILVVDGHTGAVGYEGIPGHFYERIGVNWTGNLGADGAYGNPAVWKDLGTDRPGSWVTEGVFGTPLLVHPDTGVSLIPDGASKSFKMSRKVKDVKLVLYSTNFGRTWADTTSTWATDLEGSQNARTFAMSAGYIYMVFYTTTANGWETANNAEVLEHGDVWASTWHSSARGSALISNLIGKVPAGTDQSVGIAEALTRKTLLPDTEKLDASNGEEPRHGALDNIGSSGPAAKVLPYLTRENGRLYLQTLFKEMKHNGTAWGDDSAFTVLDGVSTITDDNGATVLVGQKRIALPYFIGDDA